MSYPKLCLYAALVASMAANMLSAQPHPIAYGIAVWPPVCLWAAHRLMTHYRPDPGWSRGLQVVGAVLIAMPAAWVSYWHMQTLAAKYGENVVASHLIPLTVDGLVLVASLSKERDGRSTRHSEEGEVASFQVEKSAPDPLDVEIEELSKTEACKTYLRDGVPQAKVAELVGCSRSTVKNAARELKDSDDV